MAEAKAANTDDERMQSLLGDVRYHRAMAIASADSDATREYHAGKLRDALDEMRKIALARAANDDGTATADASEGNGIKSADGIKARGTLNTNGESKNG